MGSDGPAAAAGTAWEKTMRLTRGLTAAIAVAASAVLLPAAFLKSGSLHFEITVSKELACSLLVLLILANTYIVSRRIDFRQLRQKIESLLGGHDAAGDFLKLPGEAEGAFASVGVVPGSTIGSYKLLEQIGEGGFAVVFMAEQEEPVRRRVALKVIKPGMDSRDVVARILYGFFALGLITPREPRQIKVQLKTDGGKYA